MPSVSKKQSNFMALVEKNPKATKGMGSPAKAGKNFAAADKAKGSTGKAKAKTAEPTQSMKWPKGKTKPMSTDRGSFSFKKNRSDD